MIILIGTTIYVGNPLQTTTIKDIFIAWLTSILKDVDGCLPLVRLASGTLRFYNGFRPKVGSVTADAWIVTNLRPFPRKRERFYDKCFLWRILFRAFLLDFLTLFAHWVSDKRNKWKVGQIKHKQWLTKRNHNCHSSMFCIRFLRSAIPDNFSPAWKVGLFFFRGSRSSFSHGRPSTESQASRKFMQLTLKIHRAHASKQNNQGSIT